MDDFTFGLVRGHQNRANDAETVSMAAAMGMMQANKQIRELEEKLAIAYADVADRKAQSDALQAKHANSPLLALTAERYKKASMNGEAKNVIRTVYEKAFDASGRANGITNPAHIRLD